ncbi:intraflagellar transport-associated protein-like isoform X1 [Sciurus carolinensis]|uniref:intraflagellar transport-associated protein-like isoform X1 n=1 Tax=Sciurus carolinensis TaxID=30640 RepID=UPI001FB2D2E6|nr:intraflagellar transport-associated protein-like isoform X1 [Sciurus carolinensis]
MPAQTLGLEIMDEDQLMEEVLDKFVNCHEQTYEEFWSTFTDLSKEDNVTKRGAFETDSSGKIFTSVKFTHKNEPNDHHLRNTTVFHHTSSHIKVDNFLDLEDLDMDEEIKPQMNKDFLLLPGTGEEDVRVCSYSPSVDQFLTAEVKPKPTVKGTQKQAEKILGDEVHPFSLDEEFDYDNMAQTPKFTAEEMEPIRELLKEERKNTNTDL